MGILKKLKSDNGPAYISKFQKFLQLWNIIYSIGIPYNLQGQAIVEYTYLMLKWQLQNQKGGISHNKPQSYLDLASFTFNFLNPVGNLIGTLAEIHW